jgi:hypothetical protein
MRPRPPLSFRRRLNERDVSQVSRFFGATEPDGSTALDYEQTLQALLSLIGRNVLVLFSGSADGPFVVGVLSGRLDRGELDERLQDVILRADDAPVETLLFHVGSRQSGFVLRPDEFDTAFWQTRHQLTMHLGGCAVTVLVQGELGAALERDEADAGD